jgi:hypothetical protein
MGVFEFQEDCVVSGQFNAVPVLQSKMLEALMENLNFRKWEVGLFAANGFLGALVLFCKYILRVRNEDVSSALSYLLAFGSLFCCALMIHIIVRSGVKSSSRG